MKNILLFILFSLAINLFAEDGSRLWLRYELLSEQISENYKQIISTVCPITYSETTKIITREFLSAFEDMTGKRLNLSKKRTGNCLVFLIDKKIEKGYSIQTQKDNKSGISILIAAADDINLLYGTFHLLRLMQMQGNISDLNIVEKPAYDRRILNHWDNIDGTIERGYAGRSLWNWEDLPEKSDPRYTEYARANASIGINGTVLNNVNANPKFISREYLIKTAEIANIFRKWGIRVYLSVNFSSPSELGGLPTSDPLNKEVRRWWKEKAKEIYSFIPDFGGFLVKANSEGLPGPQDFGRTHVDGANLLAEALEPYGGIVMWRAFVYDAKSTDRAKQAYDEFMPLDGRFHKNVIIQVKNGPIDFQPREPLHPLFGAMQKTPLMIEFQITQEYLGFSKQLAYLAPLYVECLQSDTYAKGKGSVTAKCTDGTLFPQTITAIAGVANTGNDSNWTGHHFAQANWYCFGRLAWNHELTSEHIADEWLRMTFSNETAFIEPVKRMMAESREAVVNYMMPLGLAHLFAWEHHYGPEPWLNIPDARPDWMPSYYHKADAIGLGFDRTHAGSNAVSQYFPPLSTIYDQIETCPENLLLWFHHVPWNYRMQNGNTLWENLCRKYQDGVEAAREFQKIWDKTAFFIDKERFEHVQSKLKVQTRDAIWWRDACLLYFQTFSRQPIPYEQERPVHTLEELNVSKF
ncbi:MAG: alpha-glucuronidase [Dysgonamonadaceae bacterium]|nr:alpha-glucuronidase [Dysgonamonadaceae bacterium]